MAWFVVDVESDGPAAGINSLVCFAAVRVDADLKTTFYAKTAPACDVWAPEALAISGFSREEHLSFPPARDAFVDFAAWLKVVGGKEKPVFVSDNPAFDWQFINWGFWKYNGENPFGWSARRVGDIWAGMQKDCSDGTWRKLVKTAHTHNPLDDAKGVAEALLEMERMGLRLPFAKRRRGPSIGV